MKLPCQDLAGFVQGAIDRPHPGFAPHLKSHIKAPLSLVLFVWIARLNLLDVLDVIWELNALMAAGGLRN